MKTIKIMSPIPIKSAIIPTTIPTTTEFQSKTQNKIQLNIKIVKQIKQCEKMKEYIFKMNNI
jgi:hypothetical protein